MYCSQLTLILVHGENSPISSTFAIAWVEIRGQTLCNIWKYFKMFFVPTCFMFHTSCLWCRIVQDVEDVWSTIAIIGHNDSLQWHHNKSDDVSIHRCLQCLLNYFSGAEQRKHQSSATLALVRVIQRWPANSPHKGPVTRKMFPFKTPSCICLPPTVPYQCYMCFQIAASAWLPLLALWAFRNHGADVG